MGICASCLKGRNRQAAASEGTPLLYDQRSTSLTYASTDAATGPKAARDLTKIVQATQEHLIDVTTIGQVYPDASLETDMSLAQTLSTVSISWDLPQLRELTDEEASRVDQVHSKFLSLYKSLPEFEATDLVNSF